MRSLYEDVLDTLEATTFSIPGTTIRKPYDESPKTYPLIVVHEIVNIPATRATVSGEDRTAAAYQLDIQTQNCVDDDGDVLTRYEAGRVLVSEVTDALDTLGVSRRSITEQPIAPDVLAHIWRGDCVLDSYGYVYRP